LKPLVTCAQPRAMQVVQVHRAAFFEWLNTLARPRTAYEPTPYSRKTSAPGCLAFHQACARLWNCNTLMRRRMHRVTSCAFDDPVQTGTRALLWRGNCCTTAGDITTVR